MAGNSSIRVRFAPSPTGYLHVGSARTFIFNWLFARHTGGTMILRLDDTDVERNSQESVDSIFGGLRWLGLNWDEEYKQSERLALHRAAAQKIFEKGLAYRDFTPPSAGERDRSEGPWLYSSDMRNMSREESERRAAAGEPFALRFRVPRDTEEPIRFNDAVYGEQSKSTADIEDFALLRSDGMPTYHMASCADDADLKISHIIRGQDHLTNTFKHIQIFRALGVQPPTFAHLPLLVAPDGAKLSKRKHGPVVSVTTYADAGFLSQAFINFLCLLGWSPKDDREYMPLEEITKIFALENINRANAVINFREPLSETDLSTITSAGSGSLRSDEIIDTGASKGMAGRRILIPGRRGLPEEAFDPKAIWLNAEHIRAMPIDQLADLLLPIVEEAGFPVSRKKMVEITPLIRERIKLLREVLDIARFLVDDDVRLGAERVQLLPVLTKAFEVLQNCEFRHDALNTCLRGAAAQLGIKAGQMFQPIRWAISGSASSPPLFESLETLGKEITLKRIQAAMSSELIYRTVTSYICGEIDLDSCRAQLTRFRGEVLNVKAAELIRLLFESIETTVQEDELKRKLADGILVFVAQASHGPLGVSSGTRTRNDSDIRFSPSGVSQNS